MASEEQKAGGGEALRELAAKWHAKVKPLHRLGESNQILAAWVDECANELEALAAAPSEPPDEVGPHEEFQHRVHPWMLACFGAAISSDKVERNHRFLEEALELVHSCGTTQSEAHQLVDYVYGRPMGQASQEVGGVMVTLAALCLAQGLDMHASGETELSRIWTKVEEIRAKQAAKPKHSPLAVLAAPAPIPTEGLREALEKLANKWLEDKPYRDDQYWEGVRECGRQIIKLLDPVALAAPAPKPAPPAKPCYVLGMTTIRKVAEMGCLDTEQVAFVAADDLIHKTISTQVPQELAVKILEVAQLHNDSEAGGTVYMPDESEWGEIVGIAREAAKL